MLLQVVLPALPLPATVSLGPACQAMATTAGDPFSSAGSELQSPRTCGSVTAVCLILLE
jgi:hypothetical protein